MIICYFQLLFKYYLLFDVQIQKDSVTVSSYYWKIASVQTTSWRSKFIDINVNFKLTIWNVHLDGIN